jgi:hypothetical protein
MLAVVVLRMRLIFWGLGVLAGQGQYPGSVGLGPGLLGEGAASVDPVMETCQHVGSVDLIARAAEVLAERAEVGPAVDAVLHELGGLRLVRVGARASVDAQLGLERRADGPGFGEADQALGEVRCLRPDSQMASRRAAR